MTLANSYHFSKPIDLVIFDCDGVLVDSETLSKRTLLTMLHESDADVSEDYFYRHFLGYSFEHVKKKVWEDFSLMLTDDFRLAFRAKLQQVFSAELQTTVDLDKMLSKLNVKSCVATSGSPEKVKHSLAVTGFDTFFKGNVFTASEVKNGKPAPDLFLHAANTMGVLPKHCLVIEDSQAGIQGALAAEMNVVRYVGGSHLVNQALSHDDVQTISHWQQLYKLIPDLSR